MKNFMIGLNQNCLFKHTWSNWSVVHETTICNRNGNPIGFSKVQERQCSKCNKLAVNVIKTYLT